MEQKLGTEHEKNWHKVHLDSRTLGQKVADLIADFVGSWTFLIIHAIWFTAWIVFHAEPFPYGLLTMIVSLEAIFLSTFIMISQNRQSDRDRHQAEADYKTNRDAKREIEGLDTNLSRIELQKLDRILAILGENK